MDDLIDRTRMAATLVEAAASLLLGIVFGLVIGGVYL